MALWSDGRVAVCALWWRWQVSTGRRDGEELGAHRYREVRYEDLGAQPEESLRSLAGFLNLPYAPEMAACHVGKTRDKPGLSAKQAWLPPTAGLRKWQTQLSERDLELFEALAGDLLCELGYERSFEAASSETTALAERCRRWWEAELARRAKRVRAKKG